MLRRYIVALGAVDIGGVMQKNLKYWVITALVAFAIGTAGVMDLVAPPSLVAEMAHLGYPVYLPMILGLWKVAGAIVLVLPRTAFLKEWAYAGIAFDLTGAAASHVFSHDSLEQVMVPLVLFGMMAASWALRPELRRLSSR